jgi:uncharacterized protein YbcV (DUF1398 family)
MNTRIISETSKQSLENDLPFPEVVRQLLPAGVESYYTDLVRLRKTFYGREGESYKEELELEKKSSVAERFNAAEVRTTLDMIRERKIGYADFLRRMAAAGVMSYIVFLYGKKAIYFGRSGDLHVEPFPDTR